jgi:hypothetical protein
MSVGLGYAYKIVAIPNLGQAVPAHGPTGQPLKWLFPIGLAKESALGKKDFPSNDTGHRHVASGPYRRSRWQRNVGL